MSEEFLEIDNYKKQRKIGQGAFSEVYRIVEKATGDIYAAKISLKEVNQNSRKEMLNISREVNILSKLEHPCILKFIGYSPVDFNHDSKPVIITEYSTNGSLEQILELERSGRSLPDWDQTKKLAVIYGIAAGMEYLHSHDIIHRDLKPDNIFLDEYLIPKIADFGLSKMNHNRITLSSIDTSSGIKGTPAYIAPEIWRDSENNIRYTKAGDVYSFSLIVYEIITGEIPYEKYTMLQLMGKVVLQGARPQFRYPIPDSYRQLIEDCWAQKPNKRPPFLEIVQKLKKDSGFLSNGVDKNDFLDYVEYIDKSVSAFKSSRTIIDFTKSPSIKKVSILGSPPPSPRKPPDRSPDKSPEQLPKSDTEIPLFSEKEFSQLSQSCQKLVREAEYDEEKQFLVGKNILEGIGFTKNLELAIKYLKKAIKNGSINSTIYYCRILIEGKLVPPNPGKAEKYLALYFCRKNPTIYTLYGKAKKAENNYEEAAKYFLKSSSLGNAEAMYEYGMMFLNGEGVPRDENRANQYIEMAKKNGFKIKVTEEETNNPRTGKRRKSSIELRIIRPQCFEKLDESCQNSVISAESGDPFALVHVARGFLEGNNGFPHKVKLGIKYLEYGTKLKVVELMQLYGNFLFNGTFVPKNEEKGIEILNDSATILNSSEMKLQLVNLLLSRQTFDVNSNDNFYVNYPLAKKYCKEAADAGNTKAMVLYGLFCMKEKKCQYGEIKSDYKEALKYFKLAAENNDGEGMAFYGRFLDHGYGVIKPDPIEAMKFYKRSYKKGDLTGCSFYGSSLINGVEGMRKNEAEGIQLVMQSCDQGNVYGMTNYGYFLMKGISRLSKDVNKSLRYYKMAADLGCNVALSNLGVCYRDGNGIKKDVKTSIKYLKMAIEEGYPRAAFILGNLLLFGDAESNLKPDPKEGLKYVQYAADHGNKNAMFLYANYVYHKKGSYFNVNMLEKYLRRGIEYGNPACMRLYGQILMVGCNVILVDKYEGVRLFKKAADLGDEKAMILYADALEKGEGGMVNLEEANRYREMVSDLPKHY